MQFLFRGHGKTFKLAKRIDHLPKTFISLKDHKVNFYSKPPCRLINPTKNELGKISKKKNNNNTAKQISQKMLKKTEFNQWKNTSNFINWFSNIENKKGLSI